MGSFVSKYVPLPQRPLCCTSTFLQ